MAEIKKKRIQNVKERFKKAFQNKFELRGHMTLILMATAFSGPLFSTLLYYAGLRNIVWRYTLTLLLSYLVFFLLIRLWYFFISPAKREDRRLKRNHSIQTTLDAIDTVVRAPSYCTSGDSVSVGADAWQGGGGNFSGGGATGSFDGVGEVAGETVGESAGKTAGEGAAAAIGVDDSGVVIVIAVIALVAAVFVGGGIYVIYEAPTILAEAGFEFVLAAGLIKGSRRITAEGWIGSVFKTTIFPLILMLIVTFFGAVIIHGAYPDVERLSELKARMNESQSSKSGQ